MIRWEDAIVIARPFCYLFVGMLVGVVSNHVRWRRVVLLACFVLGLEILATAWPYLHWRGGGNAETLAVAALDASPLLLAYFLLAFACGKYLTRAVLRAVRRG